MYEKLYLLLYAFAHYQIYDYPACQIIGLLIPFPLLGLSKLTSSVVLKVISIPIGLLFFGLPSVINLFADAIK